MALYLAHAVELRVVGVIVPRNAEVSIAHQEEKPPVAACPKRPLFQCGDDVRLCGPVVKELTVVVQS